MDANLYSMLTFAEAIVDHNMGNSDDVFLHIHCIESSSIRGTSTLSLTFCFQSLKLFAHWRTVGGGERRVMQDDSCWT